MKFVLMKELANEQNSRLALFFLRLAQSKKKEREKNLRPTERLDNKAARLNLSGRFIGARFSLSLSLGRFAPERLCGFCSLINSLKAAQSGAPTSRESRAGQKSSGVVWRGQLALGLALICALARAVCLSVGLRAAAACLSLP